MIPPYMDILRSLSTDFSLAPGYAGVFDFCRIVCDDPLGCCIVVRIVACSMLVTRYPLYSKLSSRASGIAAVSVALSQSNNVSSSAWMTTSVLGSRQSASRVSIYCQCC